MLIFRVTIARSVFPQLPVEFLVIATLLYPSSTRLPCLTLCPHWPALNSAAVSILDSRFVSLSIKDIGFKAQTCECF